MSGSGGLLVPNISFKLSGNSPRAPFHDPLVLPDMDRFRETHFLLRKNTEAQGLERKEGGRWKRITAYVQDDAYGSFWQQGNWLKEKATRVGA